MIYRVIFKVGYYEAFFDFTEASTACEFASNALTHSVASEDSKRALYVTIRIMRDGEKDNEEDE